MSYYRPQVPDLVGGAIDTATKMYGLLNAPEDRRRQQQKEDMAMETARLQQDAAKLGLKKAQRDDEDEEISRELTAAYTTGDFSNLSARTSAAIAKQLEAKKIDVPAILSRGKAATQLRAVLPKFKEMVSSAPAYNPATGAPASEAAIYNGPQFISLKERDPEAFQYLQPTMNTALFDQGRFSDEPMEYDVNGKKVYGKVDKLNPVADVVFDPTTQKFTVPLNIRPQKKVGDKWVDDPTTVIPAGVPTKNRTNKPDDPVMMMSLDEFDQKLGHLETSARIAAEAQLVAAKNELVKRDPALRKGLTERMMKQQQWDSPQLQQYLQHPVYGPIMQQVQAFGGTPDKALEYMREVDKEQKKLEKTKGEGTAMGQLYLALVSSPDPKQAASVLAQSAGTLSPDNLKAVITAADNSNKWRDNLAERKLKRQQDAAARAGGGGGNRDIGERDQLVSLDKSLADLNREKRDILRNEQYTEDGKAKQAAALQAVEAEIKSVQQQKAALLRMPGNVAASPAAQAPQLTATEAAYLNANRSAMSGGMQQPQQPAPVVRQPVQAQLRRDGTVVAGGKVYKPVNGLVTINGQTFKVQ